MRTTWDDAREYLGATIRRTSVTYPNSRVVHYNYVGTDANQLSRVDQLESDSTDIVTYAYLDIGQVVVQSYVEPSTDVVYTLDPNNDNTYAGLDRFGRIITLSWTQ